MKRIHTAVFLIASLCQTPEFANQKPFRQWSMTTDIFRFAGTCWLLTGSFGHEDYFAHMRVQRLVDETKYLKEGKEVYNFPDQTEITLYLETVTCAPDKTSTKPAGVSPQQAVESVEFRTEWKRMSTRPAKPISFQLTGRPESMTGDLSTTRKFWRALISVESLDIPLSDHLVVSMVSKDGSRIARISGQVGH